ncbi:MAG: hypothetical protein SGPRY_005878 [Prymnesium sp.]
MLSVTLDATTPVYTLCLAYQPFGSPTPADAAFTYHPRGFSIVDPSLTPDTWQLQNGTMWQLALGLTHLCDAEVVGHAPVNVACYDMASGLLGDFWSDGEVNVLDLGLHLRMHAAMDRSAQYMTTASSAAWAYRAPSDCPARTRRGLRATIDKTWSVSCPNQLEGCHYDCNDSPPCLLSIDPTLLRSHPQGQWHRVELPSRWSAFGLLFSSKISKCAVVGSSSPIEGWFGSACVHLQRTADCEALEFDVSPMTRLAIAVASNGASACYTSSQVYYFVPAGQTISLDYSNAKPAGVFPGTFPPAEPRPSLPPQALLVLGGGWLSSTSLRSGVVGQLLFSGEYSQNALSVVRFVPLQDGSCLNALAGIGGAMGAEAVLTVETAGVAPGVYALCLAEYEFPSGFNQPIPSDFVFYGDVTLNVVDWSPSPPPTPSHPPVPPPSPPWAPPDSPPFNSPQLSDLRDQQTDAPRQVDQMLELIILLCSCLLCCCCLLLFCCRRRRRNEKELKQATPQKSFRSLPGVCGSDLNLNLEAGRGRESPTESTPFTSARKPSSESNDREDVVAGGRALVPRLPDAFFERSSPSSDSGRKVVPKVIGGVAEHDTKSEATAWHSPPVPRLPPPSHPACTERTDRSCSTPTSKSRRSYAVPYNFSALKPSTLTAHLRRISAAGSSLEAFCSSGRRGSLHPASTSPSSTRARRSASARQQGSALADEGETERTARTCSSRATRLHEQSSRRRGSALAVLQDVTSSAATSTRCSFSGASTRRGSAAFQKLQEDLAPSPPACRVEAPADTYNGKGGSAVSQMHEDEAEITLRSVGLDVKTNRADNHDNHHHHELAKEGRLLTKNTELAEVSKRGGASSALLEEDELYPPTVGGREVGAICSREGGVNGVTGVVSRLDGSASAATQEDELSSERSHQGSTSPGSLSRRRYMPFAASREDSHPSKPPRRGSASKCSPSKNTASPTNLASRRDPSSVVTQQEELPSDRSIPRLGLHGSAIAILPGEDKISSDRSHACNVSHRAMPPRDLASAALQEDEISSDRSHVCSVSHRAMPPRGLASAALQEEELSSGRSHACNVSHRAMPPRGLASAALQEDEISSDRSHACGSSLRVLPPRGLASAALEEELSSERSHTSDASPGASARRNGSAIAAAEDDEPSNCAGMFHGSACAVLQEEDEISCAGTSWEGGGRYIPSALLEEGGGMSWRPGERGAKLLSLGGHSARYEEEGEGEDEGGAQVRTPGALPYSIGSEAFAKRIAAFREERGVGRRGSMPGGSVREGFRGSKQPAPSRRRSLPNVSGLGSNRSNCNEGSESFHRSDGGGEGRARCASASKLASPFVDDDWGYEWKEDRCQSRRRSVECKDMPPSSRSADASGSLPTEIVDLMAGRLVSASLESEDSECLPRDSAADCADAVTNRSRKSELARTIAMRRVASTKQLFDRRGGAGGGRELSLVKASRGMKLTGGDASRLSHRSCAEDGPEEVMVSSPLARRKTLHAVPYGIGAESFARRIAAVRNPEGQMSLAASSREGFSGCKSAAPSSRRCSLPCSATASPCSSCCSTRSHWAEQSARSTRSELFTAQVAAPSKLIYSLSDEDLLNRSSCRNASSPCAMREAPPSVRSFCSAISSRSELNLAQADNSPIFAGGDCTTDSNRCTDSGRSSASRAQLEQKELPHSGASIPGVIEEELIC